MYKIIFTDEFDEEMEEIYKYISEVLKQEELAIKLYLKIKIRIYDLSIFPRLYMKIGKTDRLHNEYHRMVVKNYIILYTVDELNQRVIISHIYYKRKNYFY